MRYVLARWRTADRDEACRIYYADALKAIADNTSKMVQGGVCMNVRLYEIIRPDLVEAPDERTQEEIVASIWSKIGP